MQLSKINRQRVRKGGILYICAVVPYDERFRADGRAGLRRGGNIGSGNGALRGGGREGVGRGHETGCVVGMSRGGGRGRRDAIVAVGRGILEGNLVVRHVRGGMAKRVE